MRVLTGQLGTQDRGIGCSTFRACNVLLIISRAIQITPVSTCQTRLSQRHSCCFLPAFRLLKTLLEPREAAVPCKPGGKIAQACFCLSVTRHVLPACDPSSWRTNARQGSLQVPPRPTISRDDPLPSGQRRCNRPDNNVRAHLAGRATATDGDQSASQSARQPDNLTAQSRYSLARAVGGSPHRWVEHAASFLVFSLASSLSSSCLSRSYYLSIVVSIIDLR